jgi:hypothetical protein
MLAMARQDRQFAAADRFAVRPSAGSDRHAILMGPRGSAANNDVCTMCAEAPPAGRLTPVEARRSGEIAQGGEEIEESAKLLPFAGRSLDVGTKPNPAAAFIHH